jgi:hypothetical protein
LDNNALDTTIRNTAMAIVLLLAASFILFFTSNLEVDTQAVAEKTFAYGTNRHSGIVFLIVKVFGVLLSSKWFGGLLVTISVYILFSTYQKTNK